MSVKVNLLPPELRPRPPLRAGAGGVITAAAVGVVTAAIFYGSVYQSTLRAEAQAAGYADQQLQAAALLEEASQLKAREQALSAVEVELLGLGGRRWSELLRLLRDLTPPQVRWRSLVAEGDTLTLKGTAPSLAEFALLMGGLAKANEVSDLSFRYAQADSSVAAFQDPAIRRLEFELTITLTPLAVEEVPDDA